jgi:hypothetical protein
LGASHGLIGLGYAALTEETTKPISVMDAWVAAGLINNEVGFRACPYSLASKSWIDVGNKEGYSACGYTGTLVGAMSPAKTYMTLNIVGLYVGSSKVTLPSVFQTTDKNLVGGSSKVWSILDSCSSLIGVPLVMMNKLASALVNSGGLPSDLTYKEKVSFVSGMIAVLVDSSAFTWTLLPTISFEIVGDVLDSSGLNKTFTLTLGPQQV